MLNALLVDDSAFLKGLLKHILTKHNVKVIGEANNGILGLDMYKKLKPDIVFMDVMMDDMDGIEALGQIIEFDPDAIVVMTSSMMEQKPYVDEANEHGATACINKPIDENEVEEVIKKAKQMLDKRAGK